MNAIADTITRRIRAKKRGWVFTPKDFLDVAAQSTVNKTLSRLAQQGIIRRLDHGIYDFPKYSDTIGILSPSTDLLAKAIASKAGHSILPSGAMAANMLGLSTQVPMKTVYVTNGTSKTKVINGRTIIFKHAKVPILNSVNDKINFFFQAFSYLGQSGIDYIVLQQSARRLTNKDIKDMVRSIPYIPSWMADIISKIQQIKHGQDSKAA